MSFTLNHLKDAKDALLRNDQHNTMKELNLLIDRYERLHSEQRQVIELYQQQHPETQETKNDDNSRTVSQPQESVGQQ
jgi:hypothetical protein